MRNENYFVYNHLLWVADHVFYAAELVEEWMNQVEVLSTFRRFHDKIDPYSILITFSPHYLKLVDGKFPFAAFQKEAQILPRKVLRWHWLMSVGRMLCLFFKVNAWLSAASVLDIWSITYIPGWESFGFLSWILFLTFKNSPKSVGTNLEAMLEFTATSNCQLMAGKSDTIFFTGEKNRIRLVIGHTIFFTSEKNWMTNRIGSRQREIIFIRGACSE